jgi:hypothetical protein
MFTEKCFIRKYSQELVNKLVEIGHNVIRFSEPQYIVCDKNNVYLTSILPDKDINEYICCDTNDELFLAIASIRNDKPDYQWFVWDDDVVAYNKFKQYIPGEQWEEWWWFEVHKATVNELLEHFKD